MKKSILVVLSTTALIVSGCTANSAQHTEAAAAQATADKALQTAQQAKLTAEDAKAMSLRTDEKLNRMFRKAQMK